MTITADQRRQVRALIITGMGLNCEVETAKAFEVCGATPVRVHVQDLLRDPTPMREAHILVLIGGFSFGDHLGAGVVFANRLRSHLEDELRAFVAAGKLVLGICNGFQTLTRLGLAPALDGQYLTPQVALTHNDQGTFRDAWVTLKCNPASPCIWTRGIELIPLPIRHGEGKLVTLDADTLDALEEQNLVAMRYADQSGETAREYPDNPNGSTHAIAGICDPSGRVFGLMPHPEAYLSPYNHPHWTRQKINNVLPDHGLGRRLFQNGVDFASTKLV